MKTIYKQRNNLWAKEKLGFGSTTIGSHGCKLTSFSMLDGRTPSELNDLFKKEGCFSGDLLYDERCASALWWGLLPRTTDKPSVTPCIAEVDMSPSPGKQQHFVVWQGDTIIDPWTGTERPSTTYPVSSFRNFVIPKEKEPMKKEFVKAIEELVDEKYGDNLNEKEQEDAAKKIKKVSDKLVEYKNREEKILEELAGYRKREETTLIAMREDSDRIAFLEEKLQDATAKLAQSQTTETPDSIDVYSLGELAGAFFRKLISIKK